MYLNHFLKKNSPSVARGLIYLHFAAVCFVCRTKPPIVHSQILPSFNTDLLDLSRAMLMLDWCPQVGHKVSMMSNSSLENQFATFSIIILWGELSNGP